MNLDPEKLARNFTASREVLTLSGMPRIHVNPSFPEIQIEKGCGCGVGVPDFPKYTGILPKKSADEMAQSIVRSATAVYTPCSDIRMVYGDPGEEIGTTVFYGDCGTARPEWNPLNATASGREAIFMSQAEKEIFDTLPLEVQRKLLPMVEQNPGDIV